MPQIVAAALAKTAVATAAPAVIAPTVAATGTAAAQTAALELAKQKAIETSMQQMAAQGLTPEIQAQQIAMQDQTSTVNPYHRMGQMPNNYYNPGNVIGGGYGPGS